MRFLITLCLGTLLCATGMASTLTTTYADPLQVTVSSIQQPSCFGDSNGAIFLTTTGGTAPYQYAWSNGATDPDVKDIPAGLYNCTITDDNGEQVVLSAINVQQPGLLMLAIDSLHHITCVAPAGYLKVKAVGGTTPYNFNWSNGTSGTTDANLAVGGYMITVTDQHSCTAVLQTMIIKDIAVPAVNAGADLNAACNNSSQTLNGSGSSGSGFSYLWTPTSGGNIVSGGTTLHPVVDHAGTYTLKVTNSSNGCTASDAMNLTGTNLAPVATVNGGIITCAAPSVTLGATIPVNTTYFWQGPGTYTSPLLHPAVSNPGTYILHLTDTLTTCSSLTSAIVTRDTVKPTAVAGGGGVLSCLQPSITLSGSGTPVSITFAWAGPSGYTSTAQNPTVTNAGTYVLTVKNPLNGCSASNSVSVTGNSTPPTATASVTGVITCTTTTVPLTGGGGPFGITYSWTGPLGFNSTQQSPNAFAPGLYTLTVKNPTNNCTATATVTVTSNLTQPNLTATGGIKTCAVPSVQINANSTTPNVTYQWSGPGNFSSNLKSPSVSVTGSYSVVATNPANGCTNSMSVNVTQNITPPTVSATSATITCITTAPKITATSTTSGATFAWTGPNNFTSNIFNPSVTIGGSYTVTATNPANGCTNIASSFVTENNNAPFVYAGEDRALNCNFSYITTNPLGTATGNNITYLWTTFDGNIVLGAATLNARVDLPGTYTLTVKNTQNGCTSKDSMEVVQAPPVTASASLLTSVSCNGGSNGSVKAFPGGGNGVYTYAWSNAATTAIANNLIAGNYTVTVRDMDGCSATATATVTQPTALVATVSSTPQTMVGANNGTATVAPNGGTGPYTVKWSNGPTTFTITNLAPGSYIVTVTDAQGCTLVKTTNVNSINCALSGAVTSTNVSCFGGSNGTATANPVGATNPVTYHWSNNANTKTATGLAAGAYSVTVTDGSGCSLILSTQITAPSAVALAVATKTNVLCPASVNGSITLAASGGASPYTYAWSTGASGATANGLAVGSYTCTASDANGCTKTLVTPITATDNVPPQLVLKNASATLNSNGVATVTATMFDNGSFDAACSISSLTVSPTSFSCNQLGTQTVTLTATDLNGNSASATATVSITDNIAPVLTCPSNQVSSICVSAVSFNLPTISDNCTTTGSAVLVAGLPSGSNFPQGVTQEQFSYTDAGGNTGTCSFTVTINPGMTVNVSSVPTSCPSACNGSALATVTGGGSLSYNWNNGQNENLATGLCPGVYTVTVTDASGCSQVQSVTVSAQSTPPFALTVNNTPSACSGVCSGSVSLNFTSGGTPNSISWSNGQSGSFLSGLCPGNYIVTLTNAAGCSQTQSIDIASNNGPGFTVQASSTNATCSGTCDGSAALNISGNTPSSISWSNGQSGTLLSNLCPGNYTATLSDASGCSVTKTVQVTVADVQAPVMSCPPNITVGYCNNIVNFNQPQVLDNCAVDFQQLQLISGLGSGSMFPTGVTTQTYRYTDSGGNSTQCSFAVTVHPAPNVNASAMDSHCANSCTGSANIQISGGQAPFSINWSNGASGNNQVDLCPGNYQATITDGDGCTQTQMLNVGQPAFLVVMVTQVAHDVNNSGSGSISINVTGGVGPFTYLWTKNGQPFAGTKDLSNLFAGQYAVVVTDLNGCTVASTLITINAVTATNEPDAASNWTMYPNPASDEVTVDLSGMASGTYQLGIFDASGRLLYQDEIASNSKQQIDLSTLPDGVLLVRIAGNEGVRMKKLVKSRR